MISMLLSLSGHKCCSKRYRNRGEYLSMSTFSGRVKSHALMRFSLAVASLCLTFLTPAVYAQANNNAQAANSGQANNAQENNAQANTPQTQHTHGASQTQNEAMQLLNRMRHALHQLNYSGTLVYRRDDSLSTLHITHSVINGVERERVVRLNEQGSEVSRELKGFSLSSIPVIRPQMEKVYSFDLGRENRVANIPCRIITARPKDRARYLQKYCIDTKSGLLLDYMLVGKTHRPVEQFMFTSIQYSSQSGGEAELDAADGTGSVRGNNRDRSVVNGLNTLAADNLVETLPLDVEIELKKSAPEFLGDMPAPKVKVVQAKSTTIMLNAPKARRIRSSQLDDGWIMETLPAGFEISEAPPVKSSANDETPTRHYVISDGLSSLSVFVSPMSSHNKLHGFAHKHGILVNSGALNVISRKKDNFLITVVGEVPESTLKAIVNSLRRNK